MINWEEFSFGNGSLQALPAEDGPSRIEHPRPQRSPMSPESKKRFIVEPQVLNAALDFEVRRAPVPPSPQSITDSTSGGLPPPPRPHSRKDRPQRSIPSSPATANGDHHSIASIPNSPVSSPFPNTSETPWNNSDNGAKTSPRLSNIFRGEAILFSNLRRHSTAEQEDGVYDGRDDGHPSGALPSWSTPGDYGNFGSPQGSSQPSSPEMAATPVDGSRPGRQNRYLSGLQKITKLGRSKGSTSGEGGVTVRGGRRMSDADVLYPGRVAKKESEDWSSRYRRILDKRVKTAGDLILIKSATSVPNSPVSGLAVKSVVLGGGDRDEDGRSARSMNREGNGRGRFTSGFSGGGAPSPSATRSSSAVAATAVTTAARARASPTLVATPPRAWLSHARLSSEPSSPPAASDSSHEPPPSFSSEPRISISSTIYPSSSSNTHHTREPTMPLTTSPDRDSFIDLASPSVSPRTPEFATIPITIHHPYSSQPRSFGSIDSTHGKSSSRPSSSYSPSGPKPHLARLVPPQSGSEKPPIPTAPKPDFSRRSKSSNRSPVQNQKAGLVTNTPAAHADARLSTATTPNVLTPKERAGRIRTTRKLAQVFGQPPGVPVALQVEDVHLSNGCLPIPSPLTLNLAAKRKQHRPAASMSDDVANSSPVYSAAGGMLWPPPEGTRYVTLAPRRYSAPLSPDEFSFVRKSYESDASASTATGSFGHHDPVIHIGSAEHVPASETASVAGSRRSRAVQGPGSPRSFIDLSDEEATVETPRVSRGLRQPFSPSTASLADSVSPEQFAEDERRRKREKLAKLHRFLGSRVPPHLVLGPFDEGTPLPPPALSPLDAPPHDDEGEFRKTSMRRRRSSSATEFSSRTWSDDIDRLKEELNDHEKAINVRRAVKMEKMFGVAPPQTLYHTRAPVGSTPSITTSLRQLSPAKASPRSPATPPFRFSATPGPLSKAKSKKRPGTADSAQPLIDNNGFLDIGQSSVYMHYRHSLNSLNDIIDRDDKESLAELHDYLTGARDHYVTGEQYDYQFTAGSSSNTPIPMSPFPDDITITSPKSERRRSLPSRMSITSFTSDVSAITSPTAPETSFQQRRRRAAKLTHFFGVDYRDLMSEILESIEKGLEEERGKGTLKPDEVKDLQQKLVSLKTKRNSLSR